MGSKIGHSPKHKRYEKYTLNKYIVKVSAIIEIKPLMPIYKTHKYCNRNTENIIAHKNLS